MKKLSIFILIAAFLMAGCLLFAEYGGFIPLQGGTSGTSTDGRTTRVPGRTSAPGGTTVPEDRTLSPVTSAPDAPTETPDSNTETPEETETPPVTSSAETAKEVTSSAPVSTDSPGTTGEASAKTPETTAPVTTVPVTTVPVTTATPITEPPVPKPVVGVSSTDGWSEPASYANAARLAGFEVIILPFVTTSSAAKAQLSQVDALIMTGGEDIDPAYYGEIRSGAMGETLKIFPARDVSDFLYIETALDMDLPMLCICRGMQILNVADGGSLYQDLPTQMPSSAVVHRDPDQRVFVNHRIATEAGSLVRSVLGPSATVNSWHHQAVKSAGIHTKITATAPDGVVEAIELTDHPFAVGLQFHPEQYAQYNNQTFLKFFTELRKAIPAKKEGT